MNLEELIKFIDERFNNYLNFKNALNNIKIITNKLDEINEELAFNLINNSSKLNDTLNYLFKINDKEKEIIIKYYFEDSLFAILLETYCQINNLDIYLWLNIGSDKLLSDEELSYLISKAQNGDEIARNKIIEANIRLLKFVASKYVKTVKQNDFEDLYQEGTFGLIRAIEKFDNTKGYRFSTYAVVWIRQAITRYIADTDQTVRYPVHLVETIKKIKKVEAELIEELSTDPTPEQIAERLNWPVNKVNYILELCAKTSMTSLDQNLKEDSETNFSEVIADPNALSIEDGIIDNISNNNIFRLAKIILKPREYEVVCYRFGKFGRIYTLEEVGQKYSLTRERVRQIEAKALRKLRHPKYRKMIEENDNTTNSSLERFIRENENIKLKPALNNLFTYFPNYSKEELEQAISKLPEKYEICIREIFGDNLDEVHDVGKTKTDLFYTTIIKAINETLSCIKLNSNNIFVYFNEYSKKELLDSIKELEPSYQDLIYQKYGLNLDENNYLESKVLSYLLNVIFPSLKRVLIINNSINNKKITEIFSNYSKEELIIAINKLSVNKQNIIYNKYGLNLNENNEIDEEIGTLKNIIDELMQILNNDLFITLRKPFGKIFHNLKRETILERVIKLPEEYQRLFYLRYGLNLEGDNLNLYLSFIQNTSIDEQTLLVDKIIPLVLQTKKLNQKQYNKSFYEHFENYSKEKVDEAIKSLSKLKKEAIYLKYGNNLDEVNSIEDVQIRMRAYYALKEIANVLSGHIKQSPKVVNNALDGYNKEDILDALKELSEYHQAIFFSKFGPNLDEINTVSRKENAILRNRIIPLIEQKIKEKSSSFYDLMGLSKEESLDRIAKLTDEEKEDLYKYYGYDLENPKYYDLDKDFKNYVETTIIPKIKDPNNYLLYRFNEFIRVLSKIRICQYLTDEELSIFILKLGLINNRKYTNVEISEILGLSVDTINLLSNNIFNANKSYLALLYKNILEVLHSENKKGNVIVKSLN